MSYRREDVRNDIWDDEDFDALSNSAALVYLWSFTNPRCGMAGVYRVKKRHVCEGRVTGKPLDKALAELAEARMLYYVDGWLWVRARVKKLSTHSPMIRRSILKDLKSLPIGHEFANAFCCHYSGTWIQEQIDELTKWLEHARSETVS